MFQPLIPYSVLVHSLQRPELVLPELLQHEQNSYLSQTSVLPSHIRPNTVSIFCRQTLNSPLFSCHGAGGTSQAFIGELTTMRGSAFQADPLRCWPLSKPFLLLQCMTLHACA